MKNLIPLDKDSIIKIINNLFESSIVIEDDAFIDKIIHEQDFSKILELLKEPLLDEIDLLFLIIALSHTNFSPQELNQIAKNVFGVEYMQENIQFLLAAFLGNIDYFEYIYSLKKPSFLNYPLIFCCAVSGGNVEFLEYLRNLDIKNFDDMSQENKVAAVYRYGDNHNPAVFDFLNIHFISKMNEQEKKQLISTLFINWFSLNHFNSLEQLEKVIPNLAREIIGKNLHRDAFNLSVKKSNLDGLEYLIEKFPNEIDNMINYYSSKEIANNKNLEVIRFLLNQFPDKVCQMFIRYNFGLNFYLSGYDTEELLLGFPEIVSRFLYDESTTYDSKLLSFARSFVTKLRARNQTEYPHIVYSQEEAQLGFYWLKYFIKVSRGPLYPWVANEVSFLLDIPAVIDLLHAPVSTKDSPQKEYNELLRWARRFEKDDWVSYLMTFEKVASQELLDGDATGINGDAIGINIRDIVNNPESSMASLTSAEQELVSILDEHYSVDDFRSEWQLMVNNMKEYYKNQPAVFTLSDSKKINLPISWGEFQQLCQDQNLSSENKILANQIYYKNVIHTTLRFVMEHNPWLSPNGFFKTLGQELAVNDSFRDLAKILIQLWRAASDYNVPANEGFTLETRIEELFNSIALVARAHNWDKTRFVVRNGNQESEYYDDREGDKPSCNMGMKKRFLHSVKGHPLLQGDYDSYVDEYIREKVYRSFSEKLNDLTSEELEAIDINIKTNKYDNLDKITKKLNITKEDINNWIAEIRSPEKTRPLLEERTKDLLDEKSNNFLEGLLKYNLIQLVQSILAKREDLTFKKSQDTLNATHKVSHHKLWHHVLYQAPEEKLKELSIDKVVMYIEDLGNEEDEQADLLDYLYINKRDFFNTIKNYASEKVLESINQIENSHRPVTESAYSKFLEIYNSAMSHTTKFINMETLSQGDLKEDIKQSLISDLEKVNFTLDIEHQPLIENLIRNGFIGRRVKVRFYQHLASPDSVYESLPSNPLCDTKEEFEERLFRPLSPTLQREKTVNKELGVRKNIENTQDLERIIFEQEFERGKIEAILNETKRKLADALEKDKTEIEENDARKNIINTQEFERVVLEQEFKRDKIKTIVTTRRNKIAINSNNVQPQTQLADALNANFYRLKILTRVSEHDNVLMIAFHKIPINTTALDLSCNNLYEHSAKNLTKAFAVIPSSVTSLNFSNNALYKKSRKELIQALSAIPKNVITLNLSRNGLAQKSGKDLAKILSAIPKSVTTLDLSDNGLSVKSGEEIAQVLAAIPKSVTTLNLSSNGLFRKSGGELAQLLAAIPKSVKTLNLNGNGLNLKSGEDLGLALAAIPHSVNCLDLSNNKIDPKSPQEIEQIYTPIAKHINVIGVEKLDNYRLHELCQLLDTYLQARKAQVNSSGKTKTYLHGNFFSIFQKSYSQKEAAVSALKKALEGETIDLSTHLSTLRNGTLGKTLRSFIKSGRANNIVNKKVSTVRDFVQALQDKCHNDKNHPEQNKNSIKS